MERVREISSNSAAVTVIILAFAVLGMLFRSGRGLKLLVEDEAQNINKVSLAKFAGNLMFALSGTASIWLLYLVTDNGWALYVGSSLFLGLTILSVFYKPKMEN